MPKYEKWLGAGLGWVVTGNPLGSLLGYFAAGMLNSEPPYKTKKDEKGVSEFEAGLMVLASHLIKIDGNVTSEEIAFTQHFLNVHFDEKYSRQRAQMFSQCLVKEYDLNVVCDQLRTYTKHDTRVQVVRFLFELATSDGEISEREHFFIFKIAGYLNINDVDFRKLKSEHFVRTVSVYEVLGVTRKNTFAEIRNAYRKLVLKYHPDRNVQLSEEEKKKLSLKLQEIKTAYELIKSERKEK
jgi:DnaJ like chaperone protein